MTPQARRAPAFPVDLLNSCPPSPRSSSSAWTTTVRPKMLEFPVKEICLSVISTLAVPEASATMFPKSPACLTSWVGPPCSLPWGLKCGPADMHPFVLSPNSWTWKPWRPASKPVTSPVTLTGSDSLWNVSTLIKRSKFNSRLCKPSCGTRNRLLLGENMKVKRKILFETYCLFKVNRSFDISSENAYSFRHFDSFRLIWNVLDCVYLNFLEWLRTFLHGTNQIYSQSFQSFRA